MPRRVDQINKELFRRISEIVTRIVSLKPGVFVTITKIDTTPDLRYSRIFVSVFPESEDSYGLITLEKELSAIRRELSQGLSIHHLPQIEFKLDRTPAKADEIDRIIQQIHHEDPSQD